MRKLLSIAILLASLSIVHPALAGDAPKPDWAQVVGPAQGSLPAPREKVVWLSELGPAMATAKSENRPMFVTFRCLPCKQCSAFDKNVLEGGPELDPLLKQFVTVRLISAKDLDFRIFPAEGFQDMDLSWWGYFLSPEGRVYGIFGGRDEISDETRISTGALTALRRVLGHHYDPRRAAWDIDGPAPDLAAAPRIVTDLPGYASWANGRTLDKRTREAGCLHCHQVAEVLRQPAIDGRTFDKTKDTEVWPLPENVGITVDRDDGLRVTGVRPGSPADRAGIKPGDALAMAGGRRLFGQADFRGVLHRGPHGAGTIDIAWLRQDAVRTGQLVLPQEWRKTNLGWRTSIANGNIGSYPGFWPVPVSPQDRQKLNLPDATMALRPFGISPEAKSAGLEPSSIITAIGDEASDLSGRPLLVWFRLLHEPGDEVTLTVRNASGVSTKLTYKLPAKAG